MQCLENFLVNKETKRVGKESEQFLLNFQRKSKENFDEISVAEQARDETSRIGFVFFHTNTGHSVLPLIYPLTLTLLFFK